MSDLTIDAIHRSRREALRSDGKIVPITRFLDHMGDDTDDVEEAASCVAGSDGAWFSILLADFPEGRSQ